MIIIQSIGLGIVSTLASQGCDAEEEIIEETYDRIQWQLQNISHVHVGSLFQQLTTLKAEDYPTMLKAFEDHHNKWEIFKTCFDTDWLYVYTLLHIIETKEPSWFSHWNMKLQTLKWSDMAKEKKAEFCKEVRKHLIKAPGLSKPQAFRRSTRRPIRRRRRKGASETTSPAVRSASPPRRARSIL
jgi:hypothetical protein